MQYFLFRPSPGMAPPPGACHWETIEGVARVADLTEAPWRIDHDDDGALECAATEDIA
jgi:hypothetical protein